MAESRLARDLIVAVAGIALGALGLSAIQRPPECPEAEACPECDTVDAARLAELEKRSKERAEARAKKKKKKKEKAKQPPALCNICGKEAVFRKFSGRKNAVCPQCKSKERHRLLMHYLEHDTDLWTAELDVLHFSPAESQKQVFKTLSNLNYKTADYLRTDEDLQLDLTDLDQPDDSWDVLIVYHILEHIPDDTAAMDEMYRVLRPGGRAFVQVPIEIGRTETYEDFSIDTDKGRARAFGQKDHVRKYGSDGFRERLEAAGFEVEAVDHIAHLDPEVVARHRLSADFRTPLDERIWVLTKPKNAKRKKKKKKKKPAQPKVDAGKAGG